MNTILKAAIISLVLFTVLGVGIFLLLRRVEQPAPAGGTGAVVENVPPEEPEGKAKTPFKDLEHMKSPGDVSFNVRVVDQATGKLLPKASLLVQKVTDGDRPGEKVFESGRRGAGASTGEFMVSVPPGIYQVRGQCPTYRAASERVTVLKERSPEVVLALSRGNSISGRVLAKGDGRGIGGARVLAYPQIGNPKASMLERLIVIPEVTENAQKVAGETVSADDGSYQIDGLERKYFTVKAVAASFSPAERSEIFPSQDNVNFHLSPGGELTGTVQDSASGSGVDGAKVMAFNHVDSSDIFAIIEARSRPPFETVTSQGGGQFKFETLGAGTYNFVVAARGYQEGKFLKVRVREGDNPPQRFSIAHGLSISGTVVSASSEPVPGAKVRATRLGDTGRGEQIFIKFDDGSIPTDAQGKFHFDTLEPGKYTLLAWHRDHATEQRRDVEAGSDDITITLPQGGAIAGTITEAGSGKPIAGARVSVTDMQDLRKEDITDALGGYYVAGLNSSGQGKRYLNIHAEGYARLSNVQVQVEDSKIDDSQDFELFPTAHVRGRVVNSDGQGVSGARVMAKRKNANSPVPLTVGSAVTLEDGTFQIKDLEGGEETVLSVLSSIYLEGQSPPFSVQAGESRVLEDVVLQLGGMVWGTVMGPDGKALSGVQVSVRKEGDTAADPALSATSDPRGEFKLQGLSAGTVDLIAKSIHHLEEVVPGVKVAEGLVTKNVRIVLKQGGQVLGVVVDGDGKPVRDAQVVIQDISEGGLRELRAETDQEGAFSVENIQAQEAVEVVVEHPDHGTWSSDRVAVNTDDLKVVMPRLGGIRAVVVDSDGNPVPSYSVQPQTRDQAEASRKRLSAKTFQTGPSNKDGSFVYTGIPPGVYDVHIRAPSYSAFTFPAVEVEGQVLDLGKATLREGGTISGTVVDSSGRPLVGASLRVLGGMVKFNMSPGTVRPSGDLSTAVSDSRGYFEFRNLKGGTVSLQVTLKGYVSRRVEDLDPNVAEKSRDVKVILEPGAEIFGTVLDAGGNVKNGVSVYLTGVGEMANQADSNQRTATNSEGGFQFLGLAAGTYRVTAQRLGEPGSNETVEVPLAAGTRQEVELVFP